MLLCSIYVWATYRVYPKVDWDARTLGVFASKGASSLKKVSKLVSNNSTQLGVAGQGDFHFGVLKVAKHPWLKRFS